MTSDDIARIAEWMGLDDVHAGPISVTYRPWDGLSNRIKFDPINDPADAWQLAHDAADAWGWDWLGDKMENHGQKWTHEEALCAAVLEGIGK